MKLCFVPGITELHLGLFAQLPMPSGRQLGILRWRHAINHPPCLVDDVFDLGSASSAVKFHATGSCGCRTAILDWFKMLSREDGIYAYHRIRFEEHRQRASTAGSRAARQMRVVLDTKVLVSAAPNINPCRNGGARGRAARIYGDRSYGDRVTVTVHLLTVCARDAKLRHGSSRSRRDTRTTASRDPARQRPRTDIFRG
jgi:hypothetical protein